MRFGILVMGLWVARAGTAAAQAENATILPAEAENGLAGEVLTMLQAGGPVVVLLVAMSLVSLTIALVKLIQFHGLRAGETARLRRSQQFWRDGRKAEAVQVLNNTRGPQAQILSGAMRALRQGSPETMVREEAIRLGGDTLEQLRSWFRPLEVIATLAPLLGLFGTVLGMIEAFRQMEAAGSKVNPATLSGGIWEALLTTAIGLAVAIPTVAVLNWLERRVDRFAHQTDTAVSALFTRPLPINTEPETAHAGRINDAPVPAGAD